MSILKEPKSIDDQSIKKDTPFEKWADRFPTDKYRTFATHVSMFDFETKTSPTLQWKVDDFSKWFKDPAGLAIASTEKVPFTHYNLTTNEPAKVDKDVFGNNIINNQKDLKADYMNRTLPEKYVYGLDKKGQGDLAYEQLDIEYGDFNEMARAREEFNEMRAGLELLEPKAKQHMQRLETAIAKEPKNRLEEDSRNRAIKSRDRIIVEDVVGAPQKYEKLYQEQDLENQLDFVRDLKKEINVLSKANPDKPLSNKQVVYINTILKDFDEPPIPYGTLRKIGLERLIKVNNHPLFHSYRGEALKKFVKHVEKKEQPRLAVKAIRRKVMNEAKNEGLPSLSPVPEDELDHRDAPRIPKRKPFTSTSKKPFSMNTQVPNASGPQFQSTKRALLSPSPNKLKSPRLKKTPMTRHIQSTSKIPTDSPIDIGIEPSKVMASRPSSPISPPALDPTDEDIKKQAAGGAGKATIRQTNQYMQDIVTKYVPRATSIQSLKGNKGEVPESMATDLYVHFNALFLPNDNLNNVYEWWVASPKKANRASFIATPSSEQSESSPTPPIKVKSMVGQMITDIIGFSPKQLKDNHERIPQELRKQIEETSGKTFNAKSDLHALFNWWYKLGRQTKV
jgi:hypothetical protein